MKRKLLLPFAVALVVDAAAAEVSTLPTNFPPERYEALIARSPFTLATPPAAPAPPPDKGFADGWFVTSIARLDGQDFVTIKDRENAIHLSLYGKEPKDGVVLEKVDWSSEIGRSTVIISKDGQTAKLEFNQAELATPATAAAQPVMARPNAMPAANAPRPTVPRPGQPLVQPQPQAYGAVPPPLPNAIPRPSQSGVGVIPGAATPEAKRRIRVIQNNLPPQ